MSNKIKVFISYSHKDRALKEDFEKFLINLKRSEKIDVWQDAELLPGSEFDPEILKNLHEAELILLLISVDFNNSTYIWEKELSLAIEKHKAGTARVVPIILRSCDWSGLPYSNLNALPQDGKPVESFSLKDEAFTQISLSLKKLVDYMISQKTTGGN